MPAKDTDRLPSEEVSRLPSETYSLTLPSTAERFRREAPLPSEQRSWAGRLPSDGPPPTTRR
jgi:hypothetical protein